MSDLPLTMSDRMADLERRVRRDPASRLFVPLADLYRVAGRFADAERVLRLGLQRHPEHHSAATALGRVLLEQGRPDEARSVLEGVVAVVPDNLLAVRLLAELGAARDAGGSRRSEPQRAPASPALSRPTSRVEPREIRAPVEQGDRLASATLADLYLKQGDHEQGVAMLRELARREPESPAWREKLRCAERTPAPSTLPPGPAPGIRVVPEPLPEEVWVEGGGDESDDPSTLNLFDVRRVIPAHPSPESPAAGPAALGQGVERRAAEPAAPVIPIRSSPGLGRLRGYLARIERYRSAHAL
jgi:tetratricopeptide (TPR) repeat protein